MKPRLTVTVVLLLLVALFAWQNSEIVEVEFLLWGISIPRSVLIFLVLIVGFVAGWFFRGMVRIVRRNGS